MKEEIKNTVSDVSDVSDVSGVSETFYGLDIENPKNQEKTKSQKNEKILKTLPEENLKATFIMKEMKEMKEIQKMQEANSSIQDELSFEAIDREFVKYQKEKNKKETLVIYSLIEKVILWISTPFKNLV